MTKRIVHLLQYTELALYGVLYFIIASGLVDSVFFPTEAAGGRYIAVAIALVLAAVIIQTRFSRFLLTPRTVMIFGLFVIVAVSSSTVPAVLVGKFSFQYFYVGFLILFAVAGNWKIFSVATALTFMWAGLDTFPKIDFEGMKIILSWYVPTLLIFVFSFIRIRNLETEYVELLKEELMKQRFSVAETQERKVDPVSSSAVDEDSGVIADSMVSTGKELDNLIFFIDKMYNPHTAAAFVYDKANNVFILTSAKSRSGMISKNIRIPGGASNGVIGQLADDPKLFRSGDLTLYNRDLGYYTGNVAVASLIVVPILSRDHGLLGALAMDSTEKLAYRDEHVDRLSRFSRIAGELIVNVVMRKKQQQNAERFAMFYNSALKFGRPNLKMNDVLESLIGFIREIDDISRVTAIAWNQENESCRVMAVSGDTNEIANGYSFVPTKGSIFHSSVTNNKVEFVSDFRVIRQRAPLYVVGENINPNISSVMVVPFGETSAEYRMVITVESNRKNYFSTELRHIVSTVIRNAASAYEKAFLYQKMEVQATTDGLTGLCNHRHFQENLHQAVLQSERYHRPLSLLLMDIDKFKSFNDTYGHQIGDLVLKVIAKALTHSVRSTDLAARYGGEEFVVVLPETDEENSMLMAERIRATIEATPIPTERGVLSVTVSIGSATRGSGSVTQEQLIKCADSAMYQSKKGGRNRATAYVAGMEDLIDK